MNPVQAKYAVIGNLICVLLFLSFALFPVCSGDDEERGVGDEPRCELC